ncbi:MAG TPA: tetratricopeptide repeat protein, partial [Dissulfurispiraceae bacterium]
MNKGAYPPLRLFAAWCLISLFLPRVSLALQGGQASPPAVPASKGQAKASDPRLEAFESKLKMADAYLRTKDYVDAEALSREVFLSAGKGPYAEKAFFNIIKADVYLKRYNEARLNMRRFVSAYPSSSYLNEAYLLLGYISLATQKTGEALQYFEKVGPPLDERANIGKAEVALRADNVREAEMLMEKVSKRTREINPRALYVRAMIFSKKGLHKEAVAAIGKIMEPVLKEEDIRFEKALIFFNASRLNEAEKFCLGIMSDPVSNSEKSNARKLLLNIYDSLGKVDEALRISREILPSEMDDSLKLKIIRLYDRKGDIGSSLKYINLLRNKELKSTEVENKLRIIVSSGDPKAVEHVIKLATYLSPDSKAIMDVSKYLIEHGRQFEGTMLLRRALRGSGKGEASLYYAELLIAAKKYSDARRLLDAVILDNRYFFKASYLTAEILKQEGDYDEAIACLAKAAKFSKGYRINSALADLYWDIGDRKSALKYYLVASRQGDGSASLKAADSYFLSGDRKNARNYY